MSTAYIFFVALHLAISDRGNRLAHRYLASLLALMGVSIGSHTLLYGGVTARYPHLHLLHGSVGFWIGPLIYYYIGALMRPRVFCPAGTQFGWPMRRLAPHLIPAILNLVYQVPFFFSSATEKTSVISRGFLYWSGDQNFYSFVQNVHIIIYSVAAAKLYTESKESSNDPQGRSGLISAFSTIRAMYDAFRDSPFARWATYLLVYAAGAALLALIVGLQSQPGSQGSFGDRVVVGVMSTFALVLTGVWFRVPEIFISQIESIKIKYARSGLRAEDRQRLEAQLLKAMSIDKVYLDPSLSIGSLAKKIGFNSVYVSQVINERSGGSFSEFVNGHRVDAAREMMSVDSSRSLLDVAFAAGFNSKSTFYTAFKKRFNLTPGEYMKSRPEEHR